ncbi:MAG: RNA polymerase sigma factor [Acidimicrobiia bacterium]|nr:RNA polymerase sigma factor [Acidimicrobiia bacterium]
MPEREPLGGTFEEFCRAEYSSMANALTWSLGGHDLGREAADEAFARAFERWETVGAMDNPAGWVYRVGVNWGRRRLWRGNRERELLTRIPSLEVRHLHYHDPDLASALADLSVRLRSVVVLRLLLDNSERETAEALGLSVGTVKSRLHRGLTQLRQKLDDQTADNHPGDGHPATHRSDEEQES